MNANDLPASPGAPEGFPHEEKKVRYKMGLTKEEIREHRQTEWTPSADWTVHKKRIYWSQDAVRRLFAQAEQAPPKKAASCPARSAVDPAPIKKAPPETVMLKVVRCDLRNPHLLLACLATDDPDRPQATVRVRVRSTQNFVRRMELPAILVDGHTDLFDLAHALPRKRGKW